MLSADENPYKPPDNKNNNTAREPSAALSVALCWVSWYVITFLWLLLSAPVTSKGDWSESLFIGLVILHVGAYRLGRNGAKYRWGGIYGLGGGLLFVFLFGESFLLQPAVGRSDLRFETMGLLMLVCTFCVAVTCSAAVKLSSR